MFIQHVLKGCCCDFATATEMFQKGIRSGLLRQPEVIDPNDYSTYLTDAALTRHIGDDHHRFSDTPFISTTAGTITRDEVLAVNRLHPALPTALRFATNSFSEPGAVYTCYVMTTGRRSVEWPAFAEDIRDMHEYSDYHSYYDEGEVAAKIIIPSQQISRFDYWEPVPGGLPRVVFSDTHNGSYCAPAPLLNERAIR